MVTILLAPLQDIDKTVNALRRRVGMDNGYQFNLGRDYLSPIPTDEMVLNPNLEQNPGW
jgi:hypothetical protein